MSAVIWLGGLALVAATVAVTRWLDRRMCRFANLTDTEGDPA